MGDDLADLRQILTTVAPGPVSNTDFDRVVNALRWCWDSLSGAREAAMAEHKIDRAEDLRWAPPVLTFEIERHGGTVLGSTRAEIQRWDIDIEAGTATFDDTGYRQIRPTSKRWYPKDDAVKISAAILEDRSEPFLAWRSDRSAVRVLTREVLPDPGGPKETRAGRTRRLYAALAEHLEPHGWHRVGQSWRRTDNP